MFEKNQSPEDILKEYEEEAKELLNLLKGLSEADLNQCRSRGKWSIRQIVHHIVDAEDIWKTVIRAALGNSGCTFDFNWYIPDNKCAGPLDYANRPINSGLKLFQINRQYIMDMMEQLGDVWERYSIFKSDAMPEPKKFTVADMMTWQNMHAQKHLNQIKETKEVNNI